MRIKLSAINITKGLAAPDCFEPSDTYALGDAFTMDDQTFVIVTPMTAKAYEAARDNFTEHLETYYSHLNGCLMVHFEDITLGIEDDGYAHS